MAKQRKDADMMTEEEKRAAAEEALAEVFPQWSLDDFRTSYADGVSRIDIVLKWLQIDPSEGWE